MTTNTYKLRTYSSSREAKPEYDDRVSKELQDAIELRSTIEIEVFTTMCMLEQHYPKVAEKLFRQLLKGLYTSRYNECEQVFYLTPSK